MNGSRSTAPAVIGERASTGSTIDAGNRFTFSVEEIGKVCHVRDVSTGGEDGAPARRKCAAPSAARPAAAADVPYAAGRTRPH